jgi:GDP-4-dehydro-6-deoxy-D-mannose reductase
MPVWLLTGGSGFLGRHVLELLGRCRGPGVEVVVLGRRPPRSWNSEAFVPTDLTDSAAVGRAIATTAPDVVFHLAGQTPPADSAEYYRGNTLATVHLLDALRSVRRSVRVVLAGSAAELGPLTAADVPVAEDHRCRPADSYGLSKLLATAAGMAARPPLEVMSARIFNAIGPGSPRSQAFGRFAALLAAPGPDPLRLTTGDLDARRDFIDARDVARAVLSLAAKGEPGTIYHVGTGRSYRVGEGLDHLIHLSGRLVDVEINPHLTPRFAPGPSDSRADIGRLVAATGWRPEVGWHQSLEDLWEEARSGVSFDQETTAPACNRG